MAVKYKYLKSDDEIVRALGETLKAPLVPIDTETTGTDPFTSDLLLFQFGHEEQNYVVDMVADNSLAQKRKDMPAWRMACDLLAGSGRKIAHHMVFDYKMLFHHFGVDLENVACTQLAERVLNAGRGSKNISLASIVPKYTRYSEQDMHKRVREGFYKGYVLDGFTEEQLEYSARDIDVLIDIYNKQVMALYQEGLLQVAELEFQVVPIVAHMEYRGVDLDLDVWPAAIEEIDQNRIEKRREVEYFLINGFDNKGGVAKQLSVFDDFCSISIDSPSQMLKAMKQLGVPVETSVGRTILEPFEGPKYPIITPFLEYQALNKLVKSYGPKLLGRINSVTGRLHPNVKQIGADTGRFSMLNPNFQNIPSDQKCALRDCFVAPEGYECLGADYSQQELRVLAALSRDEKMLSAYFNKEDLHSTTAANIFNKHVEEINHLIKSREKKLQAGKKEEVTEEENQAVLQRSMAKSTNFMIPYGGSHHGLASRMRVSEDYAKDFLKKHEQTFTGVWSYIAYQKEVILSKMYSETMLGRKRFYELPPPGSPDYKGKMASILRQGVNHTIQGTSADITKLALIYVYNRFNERFGRDNAYIWVAVHDEIQTMVKKEYIEEAREILTSSMEEAFHYFIPADVCPIKVDAQAGPHWLH